MAYSEITKSEDCGNIVRACKQSGGICPIEAEKKIYEICNCKTRIKLSKFTERGEVIVYIIVYFCEHTVSQLCDPPLHECATGSNCDLFSKE